MILREELFEQTDGLGLLELRGSGLEIVLFLNDKPLIYDAADCEGSVGRFTILLSHESNSPLTSLVESAAERGFEDESPLSEQVALLLELLPVGTYRLTLEEISTQQILDWEGRENQKPAPILGYYPYGQIYEQVETFVTTQPETSLNDERVSFYITQIEAGRHPALIVLGAKEQDTAFIIDGHHKLFAYWCCGVKPRFLRIECGWRKMISHFLAEQTLQEIGWQGASSYLRRKKWDRQ